MGCFCQSWLSFWSVKVSTGTGHRSSPGPPEGAFHSVQYGKGFRVIQSSIKAADGQRSTAIYFETVVAELVPSRARVVL